MSKDSRITSCAINVLVRIIVFVLYYLLLISIGVYLIVLAISTFYNEEYSAMSDRVLMGILYGFIAFMYCAHVFQPLFVRHRNVKQGMVEVTRKDCEKLFDYIDEIADGVGAKRPLHVYLTTETNACVFYNTSFWNIFFPVRKNLEIGLGLLNRTSEEELKGIIAHEFGHFSQKSMKLGSSTSVSVTIISNLVETKSWWDDIVGFMANSHIPPLIYFSLALSLVSVAIKWITSKAYKFVLRPYLRLSREMEFDADRIAYEFVGTETFVSGMYKVYSISEEKEDFHSFIGMLVSRGRIVKDYFLAEKKLSMLMPQHKTFDFSVLLEAPANPLAASSKLQLENVWDDHPSMEERIERAKRNNVVSPKKEMIPSWNLVPKCVCEKVSAAFNEMLQNGREEKLVSIDNDELHEVMKDYVENGIIAFEMKPFFNREPSLFDLRSVEYKENEQNPFTTNAVAILKDYEVSCRDLQTMKDLADGNIEATNIKYDGKLYGNAANLPIDEKTKELELLAKKVLAIDIDVFKFLMSSSSEEDRNNILFLYDMWMHSTHTLHNYAYKMMYYRSVAIQICNMSEIPEDQEEKAINLAYAFDKEIKEIIKVVDLSVYSQLVNISPEMQAFIKGFNRRSFDNYLEMLQEDIPLAESINQIICRAQHRAAKLLSGLATELTK